MNDKMLTKFPQLFSQREPARDVLRLALHPASTTSRLPKEILVIAWASVLRGYTDHQDVAFLLNNDVAAVDTTTWEISYHAYSGDGRDEAGTSTIVIEEDDHRYAFEDDESHIASRLHSDHPGNSTTNSSEELTPLSPLSSSEVVPLETHLSLRYASSSGSITVRSRGLFPQDYAENLSRQMQRAVHWACKMKGHEASEPAMDNIRLSVVNENPQLLEGPRLLHDLVSHHSDNPGTALEYLQSNDEVYSMSYKQLFERAKALSQTLSLHLRRRKAATDGLVVIPVLLTQSPELYITLLAILQAGAAFCPLTADMPEERIRFIVEDVSAKVLITETALASRLPGGMDLSVCLVDNCAGDNLDVADVPFRNPNPEDAAYIMYSKPIINYLQSALSLTLPSIRLHGET